MPEEAGLRPGVEAYHAAIIACGKCGELDEALALLTEMERGRPVGRSVSGERDGNLEVGFVPPRPDRMAFQTALTVCARNKRGSEALNLLCRMQRIGISPDVSACNQAISACDKVRGMWKDAVLLLEKMENCSSLPSPNNATYNLVISACGKDNAWEAASSIMARQYGEDYRTNGSMSPSVSKAVIRDVTALTEGVPSGGGFSSYFSDLNVLPKVGVGKEAWWEVGRYNYEKSKVIVVGVQPHRNPVRNGVSLVFFDGARQEKIGFMLLRNTQQESGMEGRQQPALHSSLMGMFIDEGWRGMGLANIFVATWLRLCMDLGAFPGSERMNKPLISLVLVHFGFEPRDGGVLVEVCPIQSIAAPPVDSNRLDVSNQKEKEPQIALYSPKFQSLQGVFGERELRSQGMVIIHDQPQPSGKLTYVRTGYDHPILSAFHGPQCQYTKVKHVLDDRICASLRGVNGHGRLEVELELNELRRALFGFAL